jgi:hypothetical protein
MAREEAVSSVGQIAAYQLQLSESLPGKKLCLCRSQGEPHESQVTAALHSATARRAPERQGVREHEI